MGPLLEALVHGGISVVTRLSDGSVGAHFVMQLDGDVVNKVSPRFLADAAATERHAAAIHAILAPFERARWRVRAVFTLSVAAALSLLALHPSWHTIAGGLVLPVWGRGGARMLYRRAFGAALRRTAGRLSSPSSSSRPAPRPR